MSTNGNQTPVSEQSQSPGSDVQTPKPLSDASRVDKATPPVKGASLNGSGAPSSKVTQLKLTHKMRIERLEQVALICSRAILRSQNEEPVLNEACRLLVEGTGYSMAWIGQVEETGQVTPVAQSGLPPDYHHPQGIRARLQDPVRSALEGARPRAAHDLQRKRSDNHLKQHAQRFGYASQIALPLRQFDNQGVLVLYSDDPDAFDAKETAVLWEIAEDLEHGVRKHREMAMREQQEKELSRAKAHYARFFEQASEGMFTATLGGRIQSANHAFARLLGLPNAQDVTNARNLSLYTIMAPADKNRLLEQARDETAPPLELELYRSDSTKAWVTLDAHIEDTEDGPQLKGHVQDLSRIRSQRETQHMMKVAAEGRGIAIVCRDKDGVIKNWNAGARRLYGFDEAGAVEQEYLGLHVPPDHLDQEQKVWEAARRGSSVPSYHTRRRHHDGSLVDVCVTLQPIAGPQGRDPVFLSIEHEASHNELPEDRTTPQATPERAAKRHDPTRLRGLWEGAAHALNNAVTPIENHLELAGTTNDPKANQHLSAVRHSARRLSRYVSDIDDVTRLDPIPLELQTVPLSSVMKAAMDAVQEQAQKLGVKLEADNLPDDPLPLDPQRMTRAITGLLEQSLRETPTDGRVHIRALNARESVAIHIEVEPPETTDAPTTHPLYRKPIPDHDPPLAAAKQIIKHHGGTVESRVRGDQTPAGFHLVLPSSGPGQTPSSPKAGARHSRLEV